MKKIQLKRIKPHGFSKEKDMQKMIEDNLAEIFDLDFLCSEFQIDPSDNPGRHRIDILAFNNKLKSFVIIECKKKKVHDAIGQGQRYFNLMTDNKNDFYTKYQNLRGDTAILSGEIEWQQAKIILVAAGYTANQKITAKNDSRVDLWEVKKYDSAISFKRLDKSAPEGDSECMFEVTSGKGVEPVESVISLTKEERKHLLARGASKEIKDLYKRFRRGIPSLGDVEIIPQIKTINYFVAGSRIISIVIQQTQLKMWINMPELKVPKGEMRDVSKIRTWVRANYEKVITSDMSDEKLDYIFGLIKQSLTSDSGKKKKKEKHESSTKSPTKGHFTEEHHTKRGSKKIVALYKGLKRDIMALGDIKIKYNERYMSLMANDVIIAYILIRKTKLKIKINILKGQLKGRKKIMRDSSEIGSWPFADYDKDIDSDISDKELECIVGFVKQSLKYKGKKRRIRDDE